MWDRLIRWIGLIFLGLAIGDILHEMKFVSADYILNLIRQTPLKVIISALLLIGINYLFLSGYDVLGLHYLRQKLAYSKILKIASIGFAVGNTAGHAYASGGAVRYWLYMPEGVNRPNILRLIGFEILSIALGMGITYETAIALAPWTGALQNDNNRDLLYTIAIILLLVFILYFSIGVIPQRVIKIKHWFIRIPDKSMTMKQLLIGFGDNFSLFLIFYTILNSYVSIPFTETFTVFMVAQSVGLLTQVPGGLGIFEGTFLYLVSHTISQKPGILASLILFRMLYYILPFVLAVGYLGIRWLKRHQPTY